MTFDIAPPHTTPDIGHTVVRLCVPSSSRGIVFALADGFIPSLAGLWNIGAGMRLTSNVPENANHTPLTGGAKHV